MVITTLLHCKFFGAQYVNLNKDHSKNVTQGLKISGNVRFMQTFVGFPGQQVSFCITIIVLMHVCRVFIKPFLISDF